MTIVSNKNEKGGENNSKIEVGAVNNGPSTTAPKQRWQSVAITGCPRELSADADPLERNGDNEVIRPKTCVAVALGDATL